MNRLMSMACTLLLLCSTQSPNIDRYSYHLWGKVLSETSEPIPRLTICLIPASRPINGRIPCVKSEANGDFAITVIDIPDKYNVCASTTDSPFVLTNEKDPSHRVICSQPLEFGAADDCRRVELKFRSATEPRGN
jgi:hypothetical protein